MPYHCAARHLRPRRAARASTHAPRAATALAAPPPTHTQTLGEAVGPALTTSRLLPAIASLSRDTVPNVRFNVAKALERLAGRVEPAAAAGALRATLSALAGDRDADVRYFATRALNGLAAGGGA